MRYAQSVILAFTFLVYGGVLLTLAVRLIKDRFDSQIDQSGVSADRNLLARALES